MNNEDRELLELAAKAAGYVLYLHPGLSKLSEDGFVFTVGRSPWNPLTDDGDALRLAVKLAFEIRPDVGKVTVAGNGVWEEVSTSEYTREGATRRAIVRAAAEIGKTLK